MIKFNYGMSELLLDNLNTYRVSQKTPHKIRKVGEICVKIAWLMDSKFSAYLSHIFTAELENMTFS